MRWWVFFAVAAGSLALAYFQPELAFSPGKLSQAHQRETQTCQDCHQSFQGIAQERCSSCHKPAAFQEKTRFHQTLQGRCTACHSEHQGPRPQVARFDHALLTATDRDNCRSCHAAPKDRVHSKTANLNCHACHGLQGFQPATFAHDALPPAEATSCQTCHQAPSDSLHAKAGSACASCHSTQAFEPATFDHGRYFRFDRRHPETCDNCHNQKDYAQYTCYGCHEHSPGSIRAEHEEEGIRNYEDCASCHPSGNEHEIRRRVSRAARQGLAPAAPTPDAGQGNAGDDEGEEQESDEEEDDD